MATATGAAPPPLTSAAAANGARLVIVMNRFVDLLGRGIRPDQLINLCSYLSRGMDYALAINDVPIIAEHLPPLVKEVYKQRNDTSVQVQAAIAILMISVKNAAENGWFRTAEATELLDMANESCSSFCITAGVITDTSHVQDTILKITRRFYPQLKLSRLIASFEAKPGYDCLMADFFIQRNYAAEEKIMLFVAQTDNLETSSCIRTPPNVSFLINGRGVESRTNVTLDTGPQFPSDITKMLMYGSNSIQAIGYFTGNYIIAIAIVGKSAHCAPLLGDYVHPVDAALDPDSEIIEGASKVSLNCPLSLRRIETPVKGHHCKHYQCFDYDTFIKMNLRKPSWQCPCCNNPVSLIDLRTDQKMVKILSEVGDDICKVIISSEGSWKIEEQNNSTGQGHDSNEKCESNRSSNALPKFVDVTMEEDNECDGFTNRVISRTCEFEDIKACRKDQFLPIPQPVFTNSTTMVSEVASSDGPSITTLLTDPHRAGTLESLILNFMPPATNAIPPAFCQEHGASHELSQSTFTLPNVSQIRQHPNNIELQPPCIGTEIVRNEPERPPIPRNVNRAPMAVHALPAELQTFNLSEGAHTNTLDSSSSFVNGSTSVSYQTTSSIEAFQERFHTNVDQWENQYFMNPARQQAVENQTGACTVISQQQRGEGAYRVGLWPPEDHQISYCQRQNQHGHQIINQCTSTHQQSCVPSRKTRQISNNASITATVENSVNQNYSRSFASQHAAQVVAMQPIVHSSAATRPGLSDPMMADPSRLAGYNQQQDKVGAAPGFDGIQVLPSGQSWLPGGRMRGSLTGSAYSAALSHYLARPAQPASSRSPIPPIVASTSYGNLH